MACLHPISWMNGWIFTKLVHLYCCDMEKNRLDFGDFEPIFKVTGGLRLLENGLSAPYLNFNSKWMDFDQICTTILMWHEKELIRFWWHFHFQGHTRVWIVGKWLVCTLSHEGMDLDQTCTTILLWHEKELVRFSWPWPHFQGHRLLENGFSAPYLQNERMDFDQTCTAILLRRG